MKASLYGASATLLAALATAAYAQSATYRCVDDSGRSTYTNVKEEMAGKKCTLVSREVSVVPATVQTPVPAAKATPPANRGTSDRRRILEEELNDEEKRLAEARQRLSEQQAVRTGDEKNYQRVLDRLKPFVDAVELHERNITQLRRELSQAR